MDASLSSSQKRCVSCEQSYPATLQFFYKNNQQKDGLTPRCKLCWGKGRKPREGYVDGKKRCRKCNEYFLPTSEFFNHNPTSADKLSPYCRECDRQKSEAGNRKRGQQPRKPPNPVPYHIRAREKNLLRVAIWQHANPERSRAIKRRYSKSLRGKVRHLANEHARRAKQKEAGTYTEQDVSRMMNLQKGRCYYCKEKFDQGKTLYHIEHVVPLSRGGRNDPSNLVLSCPTCNLKKGKKLPHEWPEGGRLL